MGACMAGKEEKKPSSALPSKENSDTTFRKSSVAKTDFEINSRQKDPCPKKKETSLIIEYEEDGNNDSSDDENAFKPDSASSIIYKRAKGKESIENGSKNTSSIQELAQIQDEEEEKMFMEENMEGVIHEEENLSKITLYSSNIAMEFTIPKARAGPILAPMHNYEHYLSQLE